MGDAPTSIDPTSSTTHQQILPVPTYTVPYWRTQLHPIDSHRSSETLPVECDIAIIGSGMAGVKTAYHLCKQLKLQGSEPSILILEAREVCSGATGRNGGHSKVQALTLMKWLKQHGPETTAELAAFIYRQKYALKRVVEEEGLDCEFEMRRSFDVFLDGEQAGEVKSWFEKCLREDHEWTRECCWVGEKEAEQVTSMKGAKGAISVPACSLWPYKFVSQLLARLVEKDLVNLQTRTPVTNIREAIDHSILETPRGNLKARKVVFATNAYTAGLCDTYLDKIVPYKGTAVHIAPTKPISPHLSCTYNINYAPEGLGTDYMNPRPSGGIVIGGGKWTYAADRAAWNDNWDDATLLPSVKPHFDTLIQRHFRGWEESGAEVSHMWTGIQASTADAQPHVGMVPGKEGLHYVLAGFNGGGMAYIPLCAEGIAKMIVGDIAYEETGLPAIIKTTADRLAAITK